jgi:hypothetical protein
MKVVQLHPEQCVSEWSRARRHLLPAIEASKGRWTTDYVLAGLVTGHQSLWLAVRHDKSVAGAVTTEIVNYPEKRFLAIHFLGGEDFDEWYEELLETMSEYGRDNLCDGIECGARAGFWKWFKRDGFERSSVFFEKDLT